MIWKIVSHWKKLTKLFCYFCVRYTQQEQPDSIVCKGSWGRPGYLGAASIHIKSQFLWLQIHHDWKTTEDEWLCICFLRGKNVHRVLTLKRKVKRQLLKKTLKSDRNKGQQKEAMTWQLSWRVFKAMMYRSHVFCCFFTLCFNLERQNCRSSRRNSLSINRLKSLSGNLLGSAILLLAFKIKKYFMY